ncbi:hypothetical protein CHUAL_008746 [Chamberlinius hualienensis]
MKLSYYLATSIALIFITYQSSYQTEAFVQLATNALTCMRKVTSLFNKYVYTCKVKFQRVPGEWSPNEDPNLKDGIYPDCWMGPKTLECTIQMMASNEQFNHITTNCIPKLVSLDFIGTLSCLDIEVKKLCGIEENQLDQYPPQYQMYQQQYPQQNQQQYQPYPQQQNQQSYQPYPQQQNQQPYQPYPQQQNQQQQYQPAYPQQYQQHQPYYPQQQNQQPYQPQYQQSYPQQQNQQSYPQQYQQPYQQPYQSQPSRQPTNQQPTLTNLK